jgi:ribokinase
VLVTLGARGVYASLDGAAEQLYDAPKVKAVDTTAAGDTFIGGFAAQLALGESVDSAIRFAQRAAALSVTRAGAQPSIPTRVEVGESI